MSHRLNPVVSELTLRLLEFKGLPIASDVQVMIFSSTTNPETILF